VRILIIGGAGMLGHKLTQLYRDRYETWTTLRSSYRAYEHYGIFDPQRTLEGVDAFDFNSIIRTMGQVRPDAVINCVGIIKQLKTAKDPIISLSINSLFPHQLANLCRASGARLIHISTDCVFNGRKGMYTEEDPSDAEDLYGRSKFLGETSEDGALTLRTSIIGRELQTTSGLVEWFLSNEGGHVKGFSRAIYTGFSTLALSRIISDVLEKHPELSGTWQVSSDPIDKYKLLLLLREAYGANIEIEKDEEFVLDRSLDSSKFRKATGFLPPSWSQIVSDMAQDSAPYPHWRSQRAS
jgi:dTDP-4-dehydrorhamnose reductase